LSEVRQVRLSGSDYEFLGLPASYHLLCRKIAERLRTSHQHFVRGDREKALDAMKWGWGV